MSLIYLIQCDNCGRTATASNGKRAHSVRSRLAEHGWLTRLVAKQDLCPVCMAKTTVKNHGNGEVVG